MLHIYYLSDEVHGIRFFSKISLSSSYYQIFICLKTKSRLHLGLTSAITNSKLCCSSYVVLMNLGVSLLRLPCDILAILSLWRVFALNPRKIQAIRES